MVKNLPAMQETWVRSLDREDPLEKGTATHSNILAWRIPWTEEPGRLQSTGLHRVGHDWATNMFTSIYYCKWITHIISFTLYKSQQNYDKDIHIISISQCISEKLSNLLWGTLARASIWLWVCPTPGFHPYWLPQYEHCKTCQKLVIVRHVSTRLIPELLTLWRGIIPSWIHGFRKVKLFITIHIASRRQGQTGKQIISLQVQYFSSIQWLCSTKTSNTSHHVLFHLIHLPNMSDYYVHNVSSV